MTDMTAFERRVAEGMLHRAGPIRPVDDLSIYEVVIAANRPQGWGFTTFSALKFVTAGAIVALFGGWLLAGILTTPRGDGMAPAARSPFASTGQAGTVAVTVELPAAVGSEVAAILYLDPDVTLDTITGLDTGFGSFVADVTTSPFTVTETIREGAAWLDDPPMSDQPVAAVPPGQHTLGIFVSSRLGPFGEFLPADPIDMSCHIGVTVHDGEQTDVRVSFPLGTPGSGFSHPAPCETLARVTGADVLPKAHFTDASGDAAAGSADIVALTTTATRDELLLEVEFAEDWDPIESRLAVWLYPDPEPPSGYRPIQRVWTYTPSSMPGASPEPVEPPDYCNGWFMDMVWIEVTERPDLADAFGTGASIVYGPERLFAGGYLVPLTYRVDGERLRLTVPLAALGYPDTLGLHLLNPDDEGIEPDEQFPDEVDRCLLVPLAEG
jgi:hypothetical protein